MDKPINQTDNKLTIDERAHLRLWASATPLQRLEWLEEVQKIVYKAGAWPAIVKNRLK